MTISPFTCIHCKEQTGNCATIHFVYDQYIYERNMYSNYQPLKETKEIDAGEVPVFVCDQCIKSMKLFAKHYKARMCMALLMALCCILSLRVASELWYCSIIPFIGAVCLIFISNSEYKTRDRKRAGKMVDKWSRDLITFSINTSSFASAIEWIMIVVLLGVYILGIVAKGELFRGLTITMLLISVIAFFINLFRLIAANAKPTQRDYKEAAFHYIYFDENILIKDRW